MGLIINKERFSKIAEEKSVEKVHTILVVDDELANIESLTRILEDQYNVITADSAIEALKFLQNDADPTRINLIISDQRMPEMLGVEFFKRTISIVPNTIRIILTGYIDVNDIIDAINEGQIYKFLTKPLEPNELMITVKRALESYELQMKNIRLIEQLEQLNKTLESKVEERTCQYQESIIKLQELNQELKKTQVQMIQKEKLASIGELAAGVAHEINNPIGFIRSNVETMASFIEKIKIIISSYKNLLDFKEDSTITIQDIIDKRGDVFRLETKMKLNFIMEDIGSLINDSIIGVERISKIVDSLRNFTRVGTEEEMDMNELNNIVDEVLLIVENKSKYVLDFEKKLGCIPATLCNRGEIEQVLLNVIINAVQAIKSQNRTDRGRILIESYSDGSNIVCKVTDDGPGIPEENIYKVFDPFFTTKDVGMGTGLGLNIAYKLIVNKYHGEFIVNSKINEGAAFIIKLPIRSEVKKERTPIF